ncbi:TPA: TauD/TfdA family dioxygenase [Burkholderia multivorans]|uniref:TauD/TfdA dioxygenase family protein n=1 Tax=Burkholderia multivorans TaxID=87883 RepID=UPI0020192C65|nr:TauD/TfdA family dioxygenase [Burkholderia multivorans]MCO1459908.1 TauD/TfdA family dioxygenase [Burkholderia multivorans]UQO21319.1 TauD/TfdA family dioxygenase [Burkholderia multivorans]HEM7842896.1 TauD/TfdA family dioxygenase [Burkholderia multivorans]HEM7908281.1 TauD/TfdA family dioxygenase [Burkholderia multivorans]HEM8539406.1 TauD/TfdA family dioxygenase [Burkholderia multivorans]
MPPDHTEHRVHAAAATESVKVTRLEPGIGAEISGVDLSVRLDSARRDNIRALLLSHKVLVFRNQSITRQQHLAFAREFGDIYLHPTTAKPEGAEPGIDLISAVEARQRVKNLRFGAWHTDTSWDIRPAIASVLRAVHIPEVGGDTIWVDCAAVYAGLPPDLKQTIDSLHTVHDHHGALEKVGRHQPVVAHPLVRTHPETGELLLYVNFLQNPSILGWDREDSEALIERLRREITRPEYQVRVKWTEGSVAFWDNRATLHYAVQDYGDFPRVMERVLVAGNDVPHRVRPASIA